MDIEWTSAKLGTKNRILSCHNGVIVVELSCTYNMVCDDTPVIWRLLQEHRVWPDVSNAGADFDKILGVYIGTKKDRVPFRYHVLQAFQVLMNEGDDIDHWNGDLRDFRRKNLRVLPRAHCERHSQYMKDYPEFDMDLAGVEYYPGGYLFTWPGKETIYFPLTKYGHMNDCLHAAQDLRAKMLAEDPYYKETMPPARYKRSTMSRNYNLCALFPRHLPPEFVEAVRAKEKMPSSSSSPK